MKQIINIQEKFGAELHTRQMVERLAASLNAADSYLLDMSGVMQISRSAADELYNLTHGNMSVDLINVEPFAEKMLSEKQAEEINHLQTQMDMRFGDIAVEKGYFTFDYILELIEIYGAWMV